MTTYFLDLHECGHVLTDQEGSEAENFEAARTLATAAARDIMCSEIASGALFLACFIEIRDERRFLGRVMFKDAVAISGS